MLVEERVGYYWVNVPRPLGPVVQPVELGWHCPLQLATAFGLAMTGGGGWPRDDGGAVIVSAARQSIPPVIARGLEQFPCPSLPELSVAYSVSHVH